MPRKYPDQTKRQAIGIRQIHDDISSTRCATAAHQRALRRWRDGLRKKQNDFMSKKTFQSDIKRTQNQLVAENKCRNVPTRRPRQIGGYPPPPCIHTVCIQYAKIQAFYGHFMRHSMGILWAFYGYLTGHTLRDRRGVSAVSVYATYVPYAPSVTKLERDRKHHENHPN